MIALVTSYLVGVVIICASLAEAQPRARMGKVDPEARRTRAVAADPTPAPVAEAGQPELFDARFGEWIVARHAIAAGVLSCDVSPTIHGARSQGTVYLDFARRVAFVDVSGVEAPFLGLRYALPATLEPYRGSWLLRTPLGIDVVIDGRQAGRRRLVVVAGGSSEVDHDGGEALCDGPLPSAPLR